MIAENQHKTSTRVADNSRNGHMDNLDKKDKAKSNLPTGMDREWIGIAPVKS